MIVLTLQMDSIKIQLIQTINQDLIFHSQSKIVNFLKLF